jgi:tetratricopeptide (TPR) repeat protein
MLQDNPTPDPSPEDSILQQAMDAIQAEKFAQAREILTGLVKTNQQNPDYWVWMSAAMETQKERLYCLQTAIKLDPSNAAAQRGLRLMGAFVQDEPIKPFPMNHPRPWESKLKLDEEQNRPKLTASPAFRLAMVIGLISLVLIGTFIGLEIIARRPVAAATQAPLGTPRPTVTPYATRSDISTPQGSTTPHPLAELLSIPYTPTPIYAVTPHADAGSDSYNAAIRAYKNGQWDQMANMMAQAATAEPGSADTLYFIGEANRLSGNYQQAINFYKSAITVNPNYAPSYLGLARANVALSPQRNVIDDLNLAISTDPKYAEAYLERSLYYLNKNDTASAQADLEKASKLNDSPLVEIYLARVLLAQNENTAALEAAKRANQMDITMLDGYLVLGLAYQANGQYDQVVNVMETYVKYKSDNGDAYTILGSAYYNLGRYSLAEQNLLEAVQLNTSDADSYFWLGQTYMSEKEYDKALENAQKARDLGPNSFDIGEGLAKIYIARGEFNNSYIAISKVEKLAQTPAQRARFLYIRAISLDKIGQSDAALRDWSEILKIPSSVAGQEIYQAAQAQATEIVALTPSLTPKITPSATLPNTRVPTSTLLPTRTLQPSATPATPSP